jgi:DNA-directed RNA polymerase specialized sigma24 family protein
MDKGATGAQQPAGEPSESGAQMEGDEPFPTQVSARDRRAFAEEVLDQHAEEVYRYVLAWTADKDSALRLTAQVLRTAVSRMERLAEPGSDVEARLVALARTAVSSRLETELETARDAGAFTAAEPVPLLLDAVARLDDTRREVLILRQLLGHSAEHAARLLALDPPVIDELEHDACSTLWRRLNHAPQTQSVTSWDALTVAAALRQGAQSWLAPPGEAVLASLRDQVLGEAHQERKRPVVAVLAATAAGQRRRLLDLARAFAVRRRWLLAGCVASATVGTVLALSMGGQAGQSSCGTPTCLVSTTVGADDTVAPSLSTPEPGGPTSSTRGSAGPVFPAVTNRGSRTTGLSTTTTVPGTTAPSSTRPRGTTTTTVRSTTTSTTPQTTVTTIEATTVTTAGGLVGVGGR